MSAVLPGSPPAGYWMRWDQGLTVADSLAPVNADIKFVSADQDFISTYGVKIVAGRGFFKGFQYGYFRISDQ